VSLYIPTRPAKAGPIGPGAGVLMTEFPLSSLGGQQSPQQKMRQAWKLGIEVPWVRAAELVIAGKVQGLPWHIEDGDGDTVDDDYAGTDAQDIRTLLEKPMANLPVGQQMFRTALWRLTCRHIGLCGNSFWYLDGLNTFGEPNAILYIRPDRMSPNEDANGNLVSWQLDKTATNPGLTISLEESIHFVLDPPDIGHFGTGLVESATLWIANSQGLDRHTSMLIGSGGRLSGILSPKSGVVGPEQSLQVERDWRTIVDTSDAAKRLQIVNAPVDFQKTTLTPSELLLIEMMTYQRDSLMGLWGVPLTAIGIHERGSAMSAGAAKVTESDDQTLLDHAVKPRTEPFRENLQARLLDPYQSQGETFTLVLDYQTFDDNSLTYVNAAQALGQPLSNNQRLNILGLDPIDPSVIGESGGPLGDEVWMPATQVYSFTQAVGIINKPAPAPQAIATPPPTGEMDSASLTAGETTQGGSAVANAKARVTPALHPTIKPLHTALVSLRNRIAAAKTPIIKRSVATVLAAQRHEIATSLRENAAHIAKKPADSSIWFPRSFDTKLSAALAPHLDVMATSVNAQIHDVLPAKPGKAAPAGAVERVMARGAARVTKINETTRAKIQDAIIRGLEAGSTINDVADSIEGIGAVTIGGLDLGSLFDEYRAEMIARTELMDAYNSSAIASYTDAGIEYVQAIDGDGDPECAARDGQIYASDDADSIEDHPNGTLDWVPVIDDSQKATSEPFRPIIPVDTADVLAFAADHAQKANSALERVSGMQLAQAALDQIGVHARATSDLADAVRNTPPAIHNIEAPIVNVLPADPDVYNINVPPLDISGVTDAINVQTEALRQKPTVKTVQRDSNNRIATVLTTPIETPMDAEPDHDPDDA
jgi:SPP1 gp7 family putative phage head morphogenesis protein